MSDAIWYYVDRAQQRHGPVTAADLAAAARAGDVDDACLVWRDGMPDWQPFGNVRGEFGLTGASASDPPHPGRAPAPSRSPVDSRPAGTVPTGMPAGAGLPSLGAPPRSNRGCMIVVLAVVAIVLLALFGFIAAVALPAYEEYKRLADEAAAAGDGPGDDAAADVDFGGDPGDDDADDDASAHGPADSEAAAAVAAAVEEGRGVQPLVDSFVANTDRCPRDAFEIAVPVPSSPHVAELRIGVSGTRMCTVVVTLGGPGLGAAAGAEITLSRDSAGDWYCTGSLPDPGLLPEGCY